MKIVIGVDSNGAYQHALRWVAALGFANPEVYLVAAVEPVRPPLVGVVAPFPEEVFLEAQRTQRHLAETALQQASELAQNAGLKPQTLLREGHASNEVLKTADELNADLLALGASQKSTLQAFFVGSVVRAALTSAKQSLLIAHTPPPSDEGIRAVLATDHSSYNRRCVELLVQFAPHNLRRLAITTAYELDDETLQIILKGMPALGEEGSDWVVEQFHTRNRQVCEMVQPLGASCESVVVQGPIIPSLREAISETQSQLLILGAQGHSLLERLSLGSISYHFATAEQYNLLILRVPA
ncbi:MAG: universal stress protein [Fimbriimonadales bacterium]